MVRRSLQGLKGHQLIQHSAFTLFPVQLRTCLDESPASVEKLGPAHAHHSHPLVYDWCRSITVEGRVESVEYKNRTRSSS